MAQHSWSPLFGAPYVLGLYCDPSVNFLSSVMTDTLTSSVYHHDHGWPLFLSSVVISEAELYCKSTSAQIVKLNVLCLTFKIEI